MSIKRITDSQIEIPVPDQPEQSAEATLESAAGILSEADQLENAARPSFFDGKLLDEPDFVDEQNYLRDSPQSTPDSSSGGAGGAEPVPTAIDSFIWFEPNLGSLEVDSAKRLENLATGLDALDQPRDTATPLEFDRSKLLENFRVGLDAMQGEPRNYDELQSVVQQLRDLLQSTNMPPAEKLKIQSEINQLDEMSHTVNINPQQTDDNFTAALQLLQTIRSDLSQYVTP